MPPLPILIATPLVAPDRVGAFAALHERAPIELALFGGRSLHATGAVEDPGVPHRHVTQRGVAVLAARRGAQRAVIAGTVGRLALPGAYAGARAGGSPFVLWDALWHQPRSVAHAASAQLMRHVLRHADAVAAYGTHVERYARSRGAERVVIAPQAVDRDFWEAPATPAAERDDLRGCRFAFVGRDGPGKGLGLLLDAWAASGRAAAGHTLTLAGPATDPGRDGPGVHALGPLEPVEVRNLLASSDVVVVPSVPTPTFREPWGLIANEAMHRSLPVIATTAVGAVQGELIRDGHTGLVVPPQSQALAGALTHLAGDRVERHRLGTAAHAAVQALTSGAWADGIVRAVELAERHHRTREHRP